MAGQRIRGAWLAAKYLDRLILLSSVYRQASQLRDDAWAIDGGNQWLWRYPPGRLDAEEIHDSLLSVAGTLKNIGGGPGYDSFEPNDNYVKVYRPKQQFQPADWRRMIYQNKPRAEIDPTFGIFDCPDASQSMGRRNMSNTPLQALNLLNSPLVVEQVQRFAERLQRECGVDTDAQAGAAWSWPSAVRRTRKKSLPRGV